MFLQLHYTTSGFICFYAKRDHVSVYCGARLNFQSNTRVRRTFFTSTRRPRRRWVSFKVNQHKKKEYLYLSSYDLWSMQPLFQRRVVIQKTELNWPLIRYLRFRYLLSSLPSKIDRRSSLGTSTHIIRVNSYTLIATVVEWIGFCGRGKGNYLGGRRSLSRVSFFDLNATHVKVWELCGCVYDSHNDCSLRSNSYIDCEEDRTGWASASC